MLEIWNLQFGLQSSRLEFIRAISCNDSEGGRIINTIDKNHLHHQSPMLVLNTVGFKSEKPISIP